MAVTTEQVKELREETGVSVMQCKKALEEAKGDREKALLLLRKKSSEIADKKASRKLGAGIIGSYVHNTGKAGAMLTLFSETDFVAKTDDFKKLAYDIAMHVTAMSPEYVKEEDIPEDVRKEAREMFEKEAAKLDKPDNVKEKIIDGKLTSYFKERVLLEQPYIKDGDKTIEDLIKEATQKFGERIEIGKMVKITA